MNSSCCGSSYLDHRNPRALIDSRQKTDLLKGLVAKAPAAVAALSSVPLVHMPSERCSQSRACRPVCLLLVCSALQLATGQQQEQQHSLRHPVSGRILLPGLGRHTAEANVYLKRHSYAHACFQEMSYLMDGCPEEASSAASKFSFRLCMSLLLAQTLILLLISCRCLSHCSSRPDHAGLDVCSALFHQNSC